MKNFLRLTLVALFAMIGSFAYADEVTFTLNTTEGITGLGITLPAAGQGTKVESMKSGDVTIEATTAAGKTDTRIFQGGGNNAGNYDFRIYTDGTLTFTANNNYITKIVMTGKTVDKFNVENGCVDGIWQGSSQKVVYTATTTNTIYTITVTYQSTPATTKKEANLAFSATTANATLGETFTAPTLTKDTNGEITFTSSNKNVATVDATTGAIELVGEGSTTIKATSEENNEYYAGEASYTLTVTKPVSSEVTLPYTESFSTGIGSFTINDVSLQDGLTYVWKHDADYKYMKASAYAGGGNKASESWLISPIIDLTGETTAYLNFSQCINKYFGTIENEATLWVQEVEGEWQKISIEYPTITSGNWSSWLDNTDISLANYAGKKIKVGFKYVSTTAAAGTWEIKNFSVTSTTSGISNITADKELDANAPVYNLAGQRVSKDTKGILIQNGRKFINK